MTATELTRTRRRKTQPEPRGRGRPRTAQPSVGRAMLVKSTRDFLAKTPPAELSLAKVARHAGVDPRLLRYYFKNKRGLLTAVTAEITAEMHAHIAEAVQSAPTAPEKLRKRILAFLKIHAATPFLNDLVIGEILHGVGEEASMARRRMIANSVWTLQEILSTGARKREVQPVDARMLHIAVIGMCSFLYTGFPVVKELFGDVAQQPAFHEEYGRFVAELVMNGIKYDKQT